MNAYLKHLQALLKKLGLAFLIFSLCRLLFFAFNTHHFPGIKLSAFFYGIRFDLVSISFLFAPLIILQLLPFSFRNFKWYQKLLTICFYVANTIAIVLNLIDVAYFDFTLKRTTTDFFGMIGTGNDFFTLLPHYIIDFWYDYILLACLLFISWFLYKKINKSNFKFYPYTKVDYLKHSAIFIVFSSLTVFGMRGGFQYKPIDIVNAGQYAKAENIPVVLNTPFSIIKTLLTDKIEAKNYFTEEELPIIYTPEKTITTTSKLKGKNVVLVILESFAKEYVGHYNNGKGYTPFIDSLLTESYVFTNAYANGIRSIEALPCILSGLPQLMNNPYVLSNYSGNQLDGLPKLLKNEGYNTSFYHGGANGTMGFNGFVGVAGIKKYYGLNEYPHKEKDYDGLWGIFDEPYLQYYASELNGKEEPFFSTVFTLSSHHPYTVPKQHKNQFPKGDLPIHQTIGYTDYALQEFFKTAQQMPWFNNTIFVFTSDHSTQSHAAKYNTRHGRFAIPIFIYDPSGSLKGKNENYFQQIDITPTILELVGSKQEIISFGNPISVNENRFVVNYTNNNYQIAYNNYFLVFDGENTTEFYSLNNDTLLANNLINTELTKNQQFTKIKAEELIKGIIQQYDNRLINNHLSAEKN